MLQKSQPRFSGLATEDEIFEALCLKKSSSHPKEVYFPFEGNRVGSKFFHVWLDSKHEAGTDAHRMHSHR